MCVCVCAFREEVIGVGAAQLAQVHQGSAVSALGSCLLSSSQNIWASLCGMGISPPPAPCSTPLSHTGDSWKEGEALLVSLLTHALLFVQLGRDCLTWLRPPLCYEQKQSLP